MLLLTLRLFGKKNEQNVTSFYDEIKKNVFNGISSKKDAEKNYKTGMIAKIVRTLQPEQNNIRDKKNHYYEKGKNALKNAAWTKTKPRKRGGRMEGTFSRE